MITILLQTTVSALTLGLALTALASQASASSQGKLASGNHIIGDDYVRKSVESRAFSITPSVPANVSKQEDRSYSLEEKEKIAPQPVSSLGNAIYVEQKGQKLFDIKQLRCYMNKGNLEITPLTHQEILKQIKTYETAFDTFDKGVVVKGWKASIGFDKLLELLQSFTNLKTFKLNVDWDQEADVTDLLTRSLQFYKQLTDLDLSGCRLNDARMKNVMEAVHNPASLKRLDVTGNHLTPYSIQALKTYFPNLSLLKKDQELSNLPLASLTIEPKKPLAQAKSLPTPTTAPLDRSLPPSKANVPNPAVVSEEQGLHSNLLARAKGGDPAAQTEIGILYQKGESIIQNNAKAYEWFLKAANQGNITALVYLGWMHLEGKGVEQDDKLALEWYQKAAQLGDNNAQEWVNWMNQQGRGFSSKAPQLPHRTTPDEQKIPPHLLAQAKGGDPEAQTEVAILYQKGETLTQDYIKAYEWFKKAAAQEYATAQVYLGCMYIDGKGIIQDDSQAEQWFKNAANSGDATAQQWLDWMAKQKKNRREAEEKEREAQERIRHETEQRARWAIEERERREAEERAWQAEEEARRAAEQRVWWNTDNSAVKKVDTSSSSDDDEELQSSSEDEKQKSDSSDDEYQTKEQSKKNSGNSWNEKENSSDEERNFAQEEAAAKKKELANLSALYSVSSSVNAGDQFDTGLKCYNTQDYARAFECFQKAANQGHAGAQYYLGLLYWKGEGVTKNYINAFEWHQKAANQNYVDAQHELGCIYHTAQKYSKAFEWHQKAANQGCHLSQYSIAMMYIEGEGVPQNRAKGIDLLHRYARQGNSFAALALKSWGIRYQ